MIKFNFEKYRKNQKQSASFVIPNAELKFLQELIFSFKMSTFLQYRVVIRTRGPALARHSKPTAPDSNVQLSDTEFDPNPKPMYKEQTEVHLHP